MTFFGNFDRRGAAAPRNRHARLFSSKRGRPRVPSSGSGGCRNRVSLLPSPSPPGTRGAARAAVAQAHCRRRRCVGPAVVRNAGFLPRPRPARARQWARPRLQPAAPGGDDGTPQRRRRPRQHNETIRRRCQPPQPAVDSALTLLLCGRGTDLAGARTTTIRGSSHSNTFFSLKPGEP